MLYRYAINYLLALSCHNIPIEMLTSTIFNSKFTNALYYLRSTLYLIRNNNIYFHPTNRSTEIPISNYQLKIKIYQYK